MSVGNLEIIRDFLDVRDSTEALHLIAKKGITGEIYNICSGRGYSLRYVLDCFSKLSKNSVNEEFDVTRVRKIDEPVRIGDATKLKLLGWYPLREIEESLVDILQFWRKEEF